MLASVGQGQLHSSCRLKDLPFCSQRLSLPVCIDSCVHFPHAEFGCYRDTFRVPLAFHLTHEHVCRIVLCR